MEPVWHKEYSPGVPSTINPELFPSCVALLENSIGRFSDRPAFSNYDRVISYEELDALTKHFAAYLQSAEDINKGDRVAIMLPNILQYPVALFGIMRTGAVVVNVNPKYTPRELEHQLKDSGASMIIIEEQALPSLEKIIENTNVKKVILTRMKDMLEPTGQAVENENYLSFMQALEEGSKLSFTPVALNNNDSLFLQYTGGTSGLSKGAVLSHGNLVANSAQFLSWYGDSLADGEEAFLAPLPLYHIFGLMINFFSSVIKGAHSVLLTNPTDKDAIFEAFTNWPISLMPGVNTLYNGWAQIPGFTELPFQLKYCIGGGAAIQRPVAERWLEATGSSIAEGYGLSETSPILTMNKADSKEYTGSIGLALPSTDISLRDEVGNEVGFGEAGELCAKGPQVMSGYWNRDDVNNEFFTEDGFFRTGDMATVDEKGYFRIVDRKKDMILVSGFNVFPNEIEEVVASCAGVLECACIGVPNEKTGEAVKVFVVLKPGEELSEEQIIEYCTDKLTAYKMPKHVEFLQELPKSTVGKILRRELRDY